MDDERRPATTGDGSRRPDVSRLREHRTDTIATIHPSEEGTGFHGPDRS